jgi:hypothetical protein
MYVENRFRHPDTLVLRHPVLESEFPVRNFYSVGTGGRLTRYSVN